MGKIDGRVIALKCFNSKSGSIDRVVKIILSSAWWMVSIPKVVWLIESEAGVKEVIEIKFQFQKWFDW